MASRAFFGGLIVLGSMLLAGCTTIPVSSMYKLMTLNPLELSPNEARVAAVTPLALGFQTGDIIIWVSEPGSGREDRHIFPLKIKSVTSEPEETSPVDLKANERVFILSLSTSDAQQLSDLQKQILDQTRTAEYRKKDYRMGVTIRRGCRETTAVLHQAPIDLHLKTNARNGYFQMIRNLDLATTDLDPYPNIGEWPSCKANR